MSDKTITVVRTSEMPWEENPNPVTGKVVKRKYFLKDPDTGMESWLIKYEPGVVTVRHWHNCSHGIYIISGQLYTSEGSFGPGDFVWFPEGIVAEHGATAEGEVIGIFVTNKPFDITFLDKHRA